MKALVSHLSESYYFTIYAIFAISAAIALSSILFGTICAIFKRRKSAETHAIISSFLLAIACISGAILYQDYIKTDEELVSTIRISDVHKEDIRLVDQALIKKPQQFDQRVMIATVSDTEHRFKPQRVSIRSAGNDLEKWIVTTPGSREFRIDKKLLKESMIKEGDI